MELEEQYLTWLYARIGNVDETRPSKMYWRLLSYLYTREFTWTVPNDDNRVEDGRYIRYRFLEEMGLAAHMASWLGPGCSVLEMLMALSERLAFDADRTPQHWFWELLTNLGLSGCNDRAFNEYEVSEIIDSLIERRYHPDGRGGLFPLQHPKQDQRNIEIWYQMSLYLQEQH